jgi:hypothetical protein
MLVRNLLVKFVFLGIVLPATVGLNAQDVASLTGIVTDATDAVVPRVDVALVNTATNADYHTITNSFGAYRIVDIPPGPGYTLIFSLRGFEPLVVNDVYLNVADTRTQNAQLHVGGISQATEVVVSSQDVTINTTDATL